MAWKRFPHYSPLINEVFLISNLIIDEKLAHELGPWGKSQQKDVVFQVHEF